VRRRVALIVDDDPRIRAFIKTILEDERFETLEADGGHGALEIVRALGWTTDLIITDIQMPKGDGLTFARIARELLPSIPIILISGYLRPDDRFEFVQKPFSWVTLANVVRRLVADKAA